MTKKHPNFCHFWTYFWQLYDQLRYLIIHVIYNVETTEYALIIDGQVRVVSPDPISNPVPDCMKNLGNFPIDSYAAVGTTFGKFNI